MNKAEFIKDFEGDEWKLTPVFLNALEMLWDKISELESEEQEKYLAEFRAEATREIKRRTAEQN